MKTHFDERFGFLISDVGRLVGKRFDDLARLSVDLTRAQCRALAYLSFYGDINQARLADLLATLDANARTEAERAREIDDDRSHAAAGSRFDLALSAMLFLLGCALFGYLMVTLVNTR